MREDATEIFVPDAGDGGARDCVVLECDLSQGSEVAVGDVLARLRSGRVNMGVQAPVSGMLVTLHAQVGQTLGVGDLLAEVVPSPTVTAGLDHAQRPHSGSSAAVLSRAPLGIALIASAAALVWPVAVLLSSIVIAALLVASHDVNLHDHAMGWADVVVLPLRLLRGAGRRALRALATFSPIVAGLFRAGFWFALAVAIPAALGCLAWLAAEGTHGLVAATRLAVYGHALQIFAALACCSILRRALSADVAASAIKSALQPLPEPALAAAAISGLVWIAACALLLTPRNWAPADSLRSAVQALPAHLRDNVNDLRASIVAAEASSVVHCLTGDGATRWHTPRAFVADDGSLLLGVRPSRAHPPEPRDVAILALGLQNELAPSGVRVSIVPAAGADAVSFRTLEANRPVIDATRVLERIEPGASADQVPDARDVTAREIDEALACSAAGI